MEASDNKTIYINHVEDEIIICTLNSQKHQMHSILKWLKRSILF